MSSNKIILLSRYQKSKLKNSKMFFLTVLAGVLIGLALWNYFVERVERFDVQIPESNNVSFGEVEPLAMTTAQIADELEKSDGKPVLLYLYTTWCGVCNENFATLNEIAREFQNTELQVLALAIDRDIDGPGLKQHFVKSGDVYFRLRYLSFKEGFRELLAKKDIRYQGRIPFTVLISRDGEVVTKFTGKRNKNSLRNKIIKELYE
jgi:peroxiredoxin